MDEDTDAANWVLVNKTDCAEEAVHMNPPVTGVPATPDSDQESEGSIGIISDHPTDNYSDEESEMPKKNDDVHKKIMPIIKIDAEFEKDRNEEEVEILNREYEPLEPAKETLMEENIPEVPSIYETDKGDGSFIERSNQQWTFADEKSKLESDRTKKTFFLDCSQEPILEVSANDTDVDTESTNSECQVVVKKEATPLENLPNRDIVRERELYISRISTGFLISMLILASSHLIRQYLDYSEESFQSPSPSTSFLDSIVENEKARPIINFCIDKQKSKENEYSEQAVEKCVIRRLRKKNKEDAVKKTEIYLQMKERILELREKNLAEKEKEILKMWRKRTYQTDNVEEERKMKSGIKHKKDKKDLITKELKKHFKINLDHREKESHDHIEGTSSEKDQNTWKTDKPKAFQKRGSWVFEKVKEANDWNNEMHSKDQFSNDKPFKKDTKDKKETFKHIKNKITDFQKDKLKQKFKNFKSDKKEEAQEEWYIKYNPVKNTIELINITTLPEQDSILIKNGNKTINGQWYFSLYGSARSNIRNKEKVADWYFRRGSFREQKRDKAKWYFDYMSARDNTRY